MTAPGHPPTERLADLREGLLEGDDARDVADHLSRCEFCTSDVDALDDVAAVLAAEGRRPLPMPASVEQAIRTAVERSAADASVVPFPGGRDDTGRASRRRPRRALAALLGAAAAVLALVVAAPVVSDLLGSGSQSDSAGSAEKAQSDVPDGAFAGGGSRPAGRIPGLNAASVDEYAADLAAGRVEPRAPRRCGGAERPVAASSGPLALVRYDGRRAVLSIDSSTRKVVVLSCSDPQRVLHRSGY